MGFEVHITLRMPIKSNPETTVVVQSEIGDFILDLAEVDRARDMVELGKRKPDKRDPLMVAIEDFLGGHGIPFSRYWSPNLGRLLNMFGEQHFSDQGWSVIEEFHLQNERKVSPIYKVVKIPDEEEQQYLHTGIRLMQHHDGTRIVLASSTDDDGDERISVFTAMKSNGEKGIDAMQLGFSADPTMLGYKLIEALEIDFYVRGPLKGRFFDLDYNFIKKDPMVDALIAWDEDVKKDLKRNVLDFHEAMPKLQAMGLNTSRGIILAGPPGAGKTMIGK